MIAKLVLLLAIALVASAKDLRNYDNYQFSDYVIEFHKTYDEVEYNMREELFDRMMVEIRASNGEFGVNPLTDYTEAEFKALRGYKFKVPSAEEQRSYKVAAIHNKLVSDLPDSVDWRTKGVVTPVKNQAECGSCWAFGSTESVESHYAIKTGKLLVLSQQQMVSCAKNPDECGGPGGCNGGTPEVVYTNIIAEGGLALETDYPYVSGSGRVPACKNPLPAPAVQIANYTRLPLNTYASVMNAIANVGPLAIVVDASTWNKYPSTGGVWTHCSANPVLDHVVQLVGYGTDAAAGDYWLIRNSWTDTWGEAGYIRIPRTSDVACGSQEEQECERGPGSKKQKVCGTCGLLFDVSYPTF